jgi:hypothetical protein
MIGIGAGCGCLSLIVGVIVIFLVFAAASGGRQQQGGGGQQQGGGGQQQGGGGQQQGGGGQQQGGGGQQQGAGVPGLRIPLVMVKVGGSAEQPEPGDPTDVFGANERIGGRGTFEVVQGSHDIVLVYIKQEGGRVVPVKQPQRTQINEQMQGKGFTYVISALPSGEYGFAVFKVTGQDQFQIVNGRVFRVQ